MFFSVGKYFGKAEITIRQIEKRKTPTEMVINVVVSPTHFGPKRKAQTTTARARWKKENNSRRKVGAVHSIWKLFQNKVTYPSGNCLCVWDYEKTQVFSTRRRLKRKKNQPTSRENSMFKGKRVAQRSEWNERLFRLRANKMNVRIKEREKTHFNGNFYEETKTRARYKKEEVVRMLHYCRRWYSGIERSCKTFLHPHRMLTVTRWHTNF